MSERYPNSNIKHSNGSMIIHLHNKDTANFAIKNNPIIEEDFEESMDKHFPIVAKDNNENIADESPLPQKLNADNKVANFIKNSIKKKIQYN